jgi:hypothetical protein
MPDDPGQKLVRLIAPRGTDSANFGTTAYPVGADGTITVPEQVAVDLTHGAGFSLAPEQPLQPEDEIANEVAAALNSDPEV